MSPIQRVRSAESDLYQATELRVNCSLRFRDYSLNGKEPLPAISTASDRKLGRRQYLKYAGVGAAILAGIGFLAARQSGLLNRAPMADFAYAISTPQPRADFDYTARERTLKYIDANADEEIVFVNNSEGATYSWYVDDATVAETKDYSVKLPTGQHTVRLEAIGGDGVLELHDTSTDPDSTLPAWLKEFIGASSDLTDRWLLNGHDIGSNKDYLLTLPAGEHSIRLYVSDGLGETDVQKNITMPGPLQDSFSADITADPADLPEYPKKRLQIPIKGICVSIGWSYDAPHHAYSSEFPPVQDDEIAESLSIIRKELGCNAVRFFGNENERMISATKMAKGLNFKTIMASPRYTNANIDTTIQFMLPLVDELETLRDPSVVLNIGNELIVDVYGIVEGDSAYERDRELNKRWGEITTSEKYQGALNEALKAILEAVRPRFGGKITYSKHPAETIRWNELGFDIVSANDYYNTRDFTEEGYIKMLNAYTQFGKPVYLTELGYYTFEDCLKWGGMGYWYVTEGWRLSGDKPPVYSQEAQAHAVDVYIQLLNQTKLDAIYLWALIEKKPDELDITSDGIIKFSKTAPWPRKKAFYTYESYVAG
jgi:hypothetical protein